MPALTRGGISSPQLGKLSGLARAVSHQGHCLPGLDRPTRPVLLAALLAGWTSSWAPLQANKPMLQWTDSGVVVS